MLNTVSTANVRHMEPVELADLICLATKAKVCLDTDFINMVNSALYEDIHGGQYVELIEDNVFMDALAWQE